MWISKFRSPGKKVSKSQRLRNTALSYIYLSPSQPPTMSSDVCNFLEKTFLKETAVEMPSLSNRFNICSLFFLLVIGVARTGVRVRVSTSLIIATNYVTKRSQTRRLPNVLSWSRIFQVSFLIIIVLYLVLS